MDSALKKTLIAMATTALGFTGVGCGGSSDAPEAAPAAESNTQGGESNCGAGSCGGAAQQPGGEQPAPEGTSTEGTEGETGGTEGTTAH